MLGAYTKPKWLYFMVYTFFIPKVLNTRCLNPGEVVTKEKKNLRMLSLLSLLEMDPKT